MAKRRRQPIDEDFDDEFDDAEAPFDEYDIMDWCGKKNAAKGRALQVTNSITQRSFDGQKIRGTIRQGANQLPLLVDLSDLSSVCSDVDHAREVNPRCEHIAALLYTFLDDPASFVPQNMGEAIALLEQNPDMLKTLGLNQAQFDAAVATIKNAPPDVRASYEKQPINVMPPPPSPEEDLKSLLRSLSVQQLRAIASRRGWALKASAKEPIVEQLAASLAQSPYPATYTTDEDQLLRLENTLYGVGNSPTQQSLSSLWKKRGGGDMNRLGHALQGLQDLGLLFRCTQENQGLHFHWSPFVESENLPVLEPKIRLYPPEKAERLQEPHALPSAVSLGDSLVDIAKSEPLSIRIPERDKRYANHPAAGDWEYEPKEAEQAARSRGFFGGPTVMTIPFQPFWQDKTLEMISSLAGGAHDLGLWVAGTLLALGVLKQGEDARAVVDSEKANKWLGQSAEEKELVLWEGWRIGAVGFGELRMAAEHASLVVQRSIYDETFTPLDLVQEISLARRFVARLLQPLEPFTWYSWKSLAEFVRDWRPDFLHTYTNEQTWFFAARKTRHAYQSRHTPDWDAAFRPVLAAMLEGPLRWLGAVDLAYDGKDLAAFRITPTATFLFSNGQAGALTLPAVVEKQGGGGAVRWVNDTTLYLSRSPEAMRLLPLVRMFAEPTREALTFQVTNVSLARAFEHGVTIAEIGDKLATVGAPLPSALRERMGALMANYGRVHLYERLTVLELADDFALRELLKGTSLSQYIVHQFSPRLIVVRDEGVDALTNEMVKKGYTPRILSHDQKAKAK